MAVSGTTLILQSNRSASTDVVSFYAALLICKSAPEWSTFVIAIPSYPVGRRFPCSSTPSILLPVNPC